MQPFTSSETKTFEDLIFPWVNLPPPAEWTWAIPLAAPSKTFIRESQSSGGFSPSLLPEFSFVVYYKLLTDSKV